ncbi:hypothetical protein [Kribbella pratensis]|uniref:hypothetical protein n=1 Tax=Kribbella pratensis TaxID=2512112 RepID=UPI001416EFC1|nr:hypothetical protein [Kribbella pratensis]
MRQQVVEAEEELEVGVEDVAVDLDRCAREAAPDGRGEGVERGQRIGLYGVHRVSQYRIQS